MITLGTLDNFDYTNLILPVIKSFPSTAPEIWFDFFPNSVALVANFVIKDGLVAKICIFFKRTYKKKSCAGDRQLVADAIWPRNLVRASPINVVLQSGPKVNYSPKICNF